MAKPKVPREGVIEITFPPPPPDDLGSDLLDDLLELVGTRDGCAAADPDADDGPWYMELHIRKPAEAEASADRVAKFLRRKKASPGTVVDSYRRYGPVVMPFRGAKGRSVDLSPLLPKAEVELTADAYIDIDGRVADFTALEDAVRRAVAGVGTVTEASHYPEAERFMISFPDARATPPCVAVIAEALRTQKLPRRTELSVGTATPKRRIPVYPPPPEVRLRPAAAKRRRGD